MGHENVGNHQKKKLFEKMTQLILAISFALLATALGLPFDGEPLQGSEDPETRIQGGRISKTVPKFMVGLLYMNGSGDLNFFCAASLVDSETILSAAHCFPEEMRWKFMYAVLGLSDLRSENVKRNDNNPNVTVFPFLFEHVIVHEQYTVHEYGLQNDIAIVKLQPDAVQPANNKPITLASSVDGNKRNLRGSGWGMKDCKEGSSEALREADGIFIERKECEKDWPYLSQGQICMKYKNLWNPAAAAPGDSGGPVFTTGRSPVQVGIDSYVRPDSKYPGCTDRSVPQIYSSIPFFKEWIKKHCANCKFT